MHAGSSKALIVAAGLAVLGAGAAFDFPSLSAFVAALLVLWIAVQDLLDYTIPDTALGALAAVAIATRMNDPVFAFEPLLGFSGLAIDCAVAGGSVWLVRELYFRRKGHDGIGFGDVKLAAVGGALCGLHGFSVALLLASLAGLIVAAAIISTRRKSSIFSGKLPFGTILAPVLWAVWVTLQ